MSSLVASPHFRWMPGMQHCDEFGQTALCVEVSDGVPTRWYVDGDACDDEPDDEAPVPDLSHAPTLGCLLHLVREAWGDRLIYILPHDDGWAVFTTDGSMLGRGATEADALRAALLAAPAKE